MYGSFFVWFFGGGAEKVIHTVWVVRLGHVGGILLAVSKN